MGNTKQATIVALVNGRKFSGSSRSIGITMEDEP